MRLISWKPLLSDSSCTILSTSGSSLSRLSLDLWMHATWFVFIARLGIRIITVSRRVGKSNLIHFHNLHLSQHEHGEQSPDSEKVHANSSSWRALHATLRIFGTGERGAGSKCNGNNQQSQESSPWKRNLKVYGAVFMLAARASSNLVTHSPTLRTSLLLAPKLAGLLLGTLFLSLGEIFCSLSCVLSVRKHE